MTTISNLNFCIYLSALLLLVGLTACGGENGQDWEAEHGYGPVTEPVVLGDVDPALAQQGQTIFAAYCAACHAMDSRISGPPLQPVVDDHTPEFVMNYILNPVENRENHPFGQALADEYAMVMANMGMDRDQARAIYEYLRYYNEHGENP